MNSSSPKRRRPVVASTNGRCYGSLLGGLKSGDPSFGPELTPLLSIEALFQSTPGSEEPGDTRRTRACVGDPKFQSTFSRAEMAAS